jgi:hypothetical protein
MTESGGRFIPEEWRDAIKDDVQGWLANYEPLSVRHGNRRKRLGWRIKGWRENVALWLAPWLRGHDND